MLRRLHFHCLWRIPPGHRPGSWLPPPPWWFPRRWLETPCGTPWCWWAVRCGSLFETLWSVVISHRMNTAHSKNLALCNPAVLTEIQTFYISFTAVIVGLWKMYIKCCNFGDGQVVPPWEPVVRYGKRLSRGIRVHGVILIFIRD